MPANCRGDRWDAEGYSEDQHGIVNREDAREATSTEWLKHFPRLHSLLGCPIT